VELQRGLASVPALQGRVHGALVSDAQELLGGFPRIGGGFPGRVAASGLQVGAHALEELLDADLGKAPGVLRAGLVEQLALDVDVVGPVPALQEGGLGEAGPERSDQESQRGHQQHKAPAQSLRGQGGNRTHQAGRARAQHFPPAGSSLPCCQRAWLRFGLFDIWLCLHCEAGRGDPAYVLCQSVHLH